jgi:hypothetical protein
LSEAKTWLAPHRRLVVYHCNWTAPAAAEQRQAALAIPQRKIYRWQQLAVQISLTHNSSPLGNTKPLSTGSENKPPSDLAWLSFPTYVSVRRGNKPK